jgi:hypothetical protein
LSANTELLPQEDNPNKKQMKEMKEQLEPAHCCQPLKSIKKEINQKNPSARPRRVLSLYNHGFGLGEGEMRFVSDLRKSCGVIKRLLPQERMQPDARIVVASPRCTHTKSSF